MANLKRPVLKIDSQRATVGGGASPIEAGGGSAAPVLPRLPAPTNLVVESTALAQSVVGPTALAQLAWTPPPNAGAVGGYVIQWSTSPTFAGTPAGQSEPADRTRTTVGSLPCSTAAGSVTVYFRICAVAKGGVYGAFSAPASAVMPSDTTAPGPVLAASAAFAADGTLEVRATPPASANFKHIRVEVRNGADAVELDVSQFAGGLWTWSPARNRQQTAAAGLGTVSTSVTVRLYAVSWGNISSTVVSLSATSPAPATPAGLSHSWAGDTGTAAATLRVTWTPVAGLIARLSIDGATTGRVGLATGAYEYPLATNAAEHGGTPDPVLSLSVVFENGLGQVSATPATATATNAAPPATSITAFAGFSEVGLTITPSAAQDLQDYQVRVYREGVQVQTLTLVDTRPTYVVEDGDGTYTFDVAPRDVFGQLGPASSPTAGATVTDMAGFAEELRADAIYTDSLGTDSALLKAILADNVL